MRFMLLLVCLFPALAAAETGPDGADCVVLLHGLARTGRSMRPMAVAFERRGYRVVNHSYPSRSYPVAELAPLAVEAGLAGCPAQGRVHFVTHSLGGILLRQYLARHRLPRLGRVVMLAPPNRGSQVVDRLRRVPGFRLINGPAGQQLGTGPDGVAAHLGPVDFELGVIAGTATINPLLSRLLPDPDDGKVSVENTKVVGMRDFVVLPHTHAMMMRAPAVIAQALAFVDSGRFRHETAPE